jgi:arylsulfatase A-like enzyme
VIQAGSRCEGIAVTMDVYPTLCQIAGVDVGHMIDGRSMLPSLKDGSRPMPERVLYWPRREGNLRYQGQDYYVVRSGDWKLLHNHPYGPLELYNLKDDPGETTNLAEPEETERTEKMHSKHGPSVISVSSCS